MNIEKLYMFNPFKIQNASNEEIANTYMNLQNKIIQEADTCYLLSENIEIYSMKVIMTMLSIYHLIT